VNEVDVNDAAAFPVVCMAALYGTGALVVLDAIEPVGVDDRFTAGLKLRSVVPVLAALALATAAFAANILALDPVAFRLMLFRGSALSASSSNKNISPCFRLLETPQAYPLSKLIILLVGI